MRDVDAWIEKQWLESPTRAASFFCYGRWATKEEAEMFECAFVITQVIMTVKPYPVTFV